MPTETFSATSLQSAIFVDPRISVRRSLPFSPPHTPNSTRAWSAYERHSVRTWHRPQMVLALRSNLTRGSKKISGSYSLQRALASQDMRGILWAARGGGGIALRGHFAWPNWPVHKAEM